MNIWLIYKPHASLFISNLFQSKMAQYDHEFMESHEPEEVFYYLMMVAKGGKFRGIRGATYKLAFKLDACRLHGTDVVRYGDTAETSSDVYLEMLFRESEKRRDFMSGVHKIFKIPEVLQKCCPEYNPDVKALKSFSCKYRDSCVLSVTERELEEMATNSPAGSINYEYDVSTQDLGSYTSSVGPRRKVPRSPASSARSSGQIDGRSSGRLSGSTSARSRAKALVFRWQSFENHIPDNYMYSCHLLGNEYTDITPQSHPNNFVGGYADFLNGLDGLQTPNGVPRFVLEFAGADEVFEEAQDGRRQKVWVLLRFRDVMMASIWFPVFKQSFKGGSIFDEERQTIKSFVYVRNVVEFEKMLEVKKSLTEVDWRQHGFM